MSSFLQPEISCRTAKEFLDKILPSNNHFGERIEMPTWLFRGQGRDDPLVPSLFRTDKKSLEKLQSLIFADISDSYEQKLSIEAFLINCFFKIADKHGFLIPEDSQELRSVLAEVSSADDTYVKVSKGEWLSSGKPLSLAALAQHHGTPTRLIDWTLQPLIAAYFAAEGGARRFDGKKKEFSDPDIPIVFWSFYFPLFQFSGRSGRIRYTIKGVTAPGAGNPNLKAQQGVFTVVHHSFTNEKENNYLALDKIIQNLEVNGNEANGDKEDIEGCELQKITLPVTESIKLIKLLAKLDITPSSVYPGYHSIVSDIQMNNIKEYRSDLE